MMRRQRGRPAKARQCRTKNCSRLAVTGEKVCAACLGARNMRRTARITRQTVKQAQRIERAKTPITRRALELRVSRQSERLQQHAKPSTDSQIAEKVRALLAQRVDGQPFVVAGPFGDEIIFKALDILTGYRKPAPPDPRTKGYEPASPTSPRPEAVWGDRSKGPLRKPDGTRRGPSGGKQPLANPESRWPPRLQD